MTAPAVDHTHDRAATSWVESANAHADFPVQNLPFGVFSRPGSDRRIGVAIGDFILDLKAASEAGLLPDTDDAAPRSATLNAVMGSSAARRVALRHRIFALLTDRRFRADVLDRLHAQDDCALHLPAAIGDYTDFYVGIHHARNVGALFRPDNPLLPNYKHIPIGYHGRASSIRPSGVPLVRPTGQSRAATDDNPHYGPTAKLDYELELGVWIGPGNPLGEPIPIGEAGSHIAGFCLLNDWSARDFQAWEYQPLGPFLAKNFQTTISPWVVTAEAMAPFRIAQPARPAGDPVPLPYLLDAADQARGGLAITLGASIATARMRAEGVAPFPLSRGPASNMYWTVAQIVAHHASNGCELNPGDLLGTGTISAAMPDGYGSLMELTANGAKPLHLPSGETRTFLEDGDEILLDARAEADGFVSIGFGECRATVLPAR